MSLTSFLRRVLRKKPQRRRISKREHVANLGRAIERGDARIDELFNGAQPGPCCPTCWLYSNSPEYRWLSEKQDRRQATLRALTHGGRDAQEAKR